MIEQVSGISIKGRCFTNDESLLFFPSEDNRLSLVYGENGSGKSTISAAFRALSDPQQSDLQVSLINSQAAKIALQNANIYVFDENYIDRNVKIDDDGLGSIVLLGGQVERQSEIDSVQERLTKEKARLDVLRNKREEFNEKKNPLCPQYHWGQLKEILRNTSGWAKTDSDIKGYKQASRVTDDVVTEICTMTVDKTIEHLHAEFEKTKKNMEQALTPPPAYSTPVHQIDADSDVENRLNILLSLRLEEPVLTEREKLILGMVRAGQQPTVVRSKELFTDTQQTYCPYCYQAVSDKYKQGLLTSINRILNKEADLHAEQLRAFQLKPIENAYAQYGELDEQLIVLIANTIKEYNDIIDSYCESIQKKLQNIYTPVIQKRLGLPDVLRKLNALLAQLDEKRENFMQIAGQHARLKELLLLLNKQIAHVHCKKTYQTFLLQQEKQKKADAAFHEQDAIVQQQEQYLSKLVQQKESLVLGIDCVNELLAYVFFSPERLSIELRDKKYYIKSKGRNVKPKNISLGERNIIALCYFFVHIGANQELSKQYEQEQLLVIDDPVSSFDFENKVGILSLLRREIKKVIFGNSNSKVLMLTHDLVTAFDAQKALDEICTALKTENKKSHLKWQALTQGKLEEFKRGKGEYAQLLSDVFNFADGIDTDGLSIGNKMRRVLEAFSTFCYRKGIAEVSYDASILKQLDDYADYFESRMYRLVLHGDSHYEEQVYALHNSGGLYEFISTDQKRNTARDVLCFIYLLNQQHVNAYLASGEVNKIGEWCKEILRVAKPSSSQPLVEEKKQEASLKTVKLYDIPLSAGIGADMLDEVDAEDFETDNRDCSFALRISGDSMEPEIINGSIALIHKQETVEAGEIGAFFFNGNVYCKTLSRNEQKACLRSVNPKYPPIPINEEDAVHCYGKVIGIVGK